MSNYYKCMQENIKFYNEFVCLQEFLLKVSNQEDIFIFNINLK